MKLLKKEIKYVLNEFDLGNFKSVKALSGGMVNYNFIVKTDCGKFIVKILGYKLNTWWRYKKKLEYDVLEFLRKNNYPYSIPRYKLDKNGKYILRYNGKYFQAYTMIEGKNVSNMTDSRVREVARAVAKYHKIVEDFPIEKSNYWTEKWEWMIKKYDLMKKVRPKNKLDRLMKDNLEFFDNLLKKLLKIKINKNILLNHADFNKTNLLWEGNKLVGIIDFENISFRPRAFDVSYIRGNDSQDKIMLEEYRKYNSFSKSEEKNLIVFRLLETCNLFWWNYLGMDKRPDLKYIAMKRDIGRAKRWVKMWEKGN